MTRKIQIGVFGSMADLDYTDQIASIAEEVGAEIARSGNILVFGAEKDADSLSTAACRGAKREGGLTVGITYGKTKDIYEKDADVVIPTGLERGGGREFVLALACDVVIAISGGSGTLNELAVAYQADIPMVCVTGVGGWSERMAGEYFDARQRRRCLSADSAEDAVRLALQETVMNSERTRR